MILDFVVVSLEFSCWFTFHLPPLQQLFLLDYMCDSSGNKGCISPKTNAQLERAYAFYGAVKQLEMQFVYSKKWTELTPPPTQATMLFFVVIEVTVHLFISVCRTRNAVFITAPPDGRKRVTEIRAWINLWQMTECIFRVTKHTANTH
jgi:hypothetical protein